MIEVKNLEHRYPARTGSETIALQNVNLTIEDNQFITLLGPSGCGKTTLMRIIGSLVDQTTGIVEINGKKVKGPSEDCAVVFQNFALMPWATIRENVAFGLEMKGVPAKQRHAEADRQIEMVGLKGFEEKFPKELSGGMQQRVGLARALAVNTPIMLMDEPFGALDQQTRRYMQEELIKIWEGQRKTVIFVTHDMDEAVLLGDKVVLMSNRPGKIEEVIDVGIDRPRNPEEVERTKEFIELKEYLWHRLRDMHAMSEKAS